MKKIYLENDTVKRLKITYSYLAKYIDLPEEKNFNKILECMMDVLDSIIRIDLVNSPCSTMDYIEKKAKKATSETEKELWMKLFRYRFQLQQIGAIHRKQKEKTKYL